MMAKKLVKVTGALSLMFILGLFFTHPSSATGHLQYFGYWGGVTAWEPGTSTTAYTNVVFADSPGYATDQPGGIEWARVHGNKAIIDLNFPWAHIPGVTHNWYDDPGFFSAPAWTQFVASIQPHIDNVAAIFLLDEPSFSNNWSDITTKINNAAAAVKQAFPNVPVWVNFLPPNESFYLYSGVLPIGPMPANLDWVGFDCYGPFNGCISGGYPSIAQELTAIEQKKSSNQKIILIPQAFRNPNYPGLDQNEEQLKVMADQYLALAQSDPEVIGLMPYTYWQEGPVNQSLYLLSNLEQKFSQIGQTITGKIPQNSQFISQTVPSVMTAGQTYPVSITIKNNGSLIWDSGSNYKLGSQNLEDNMTWGLARVFVPNSVALGAQTIFNFNVTAPATPGTYNFQWRMLQENVKWFGDFTPNLQVQVNPISTPTPTPLATITPTPSSTPITTTPTVNSVTISSLSVKADNSTQYSIAMTASDVGGAAKIYRADALINLQGPNVGAYRGYLIWNTYDPWPTYQDHHVCNGGGGAVVYPTNGNTYIHLDSCSISNSGNNRTVTFSVHFDPSFTTPISNNHISVTAYNSDNNYDGPKDFSGFNLFITPTPTPTSTVIPTLSITPTPTPLATITPTPSITPIPTVTITPTPTPLPIIPPYGYLLCASEGSVCNFYGTKSVAYGATNKFNILTLSTGVLCGNTVFGDPAPNTAKACFVKDIILPTTTPTSTPTLTPTPSATPTPTMTPSPAVTSEPVTPATAIIRFQNDPKVYEVLADNKLKWIPTLEVFNQLGISWNNVVVQPAVAQSQYTRAKLMRSSNDPKVFYVTEGGLKRWIPNEQIFLSYNNRWQDIVVVSPVEINAISSNILIRMPGDSKVYKIEGTAKRWITSAESFNRNGFSWDQIAPVNQTEFDYYPLGATIN